MTTKTISAKDVSELRARTGAGMMDCKRALEETGGDMEAATDLLRKKGIAKAEKRAGRSACEGVVVLDVAADGGSAVMVELNCETDFVARSDDFQALAQDLLRFGATLPAGMHDGEAVLDSGFEGQTVGERIKAVSGRTGENVQLRRVVRFAPAGGVVGHYLHHNGQVGTLVEVEGATGEAALAMAREVALHVASADPVAVRPSDIPAELLERERRIAEEQVAAEGKPEQIRAKIVEGKLRKFTAERSLLEQPFVKDDSQAVAAVVAAVAGAAVVRFARYKVGEA